MSVLPAFRCGGSIHPSFSGVEICAKDIDKAEQRYTLIMMYTSEFERRMYIINVFNDILKFGSNLRPQSVRYHYSCPRT